MNRFITCSAVAILLGFTPALAADNSNAPPTQAGVSQDAAKEATQPSSGSADTSGGAMDRSSAPPSSGAANATGGDSGAHQPAQGSADTSSGAMEQSSAPKGSSADDASKPNPTIGADVEKGADTSKE